MTIDVLLEIRKVEEEAGQIVGEAQNEARSVLADAKAQAVKIKNDTASSALITAEEIKILSERRAVAEIEKLKTRDAAEGDQIERIARTRFSEAVDIIAGRIVNFNVDR
jgi:vacuolar-type H+-ATPase subunit H